MNASPTTSETLPNSQLPQLQRRKSNNQATIDAASETDRFPEQDKPRAGIGFAVTDLLQLRIALDHTADAEAACQVLAEKIANIFDCQNVFVSLRDHSGSLRLAGKEFDQTQRLDEFAEILSAQLEATEGQAIVGWPDSHQWTPSLIHKSLIENDETAISIPISAKSGRTFGAVTVIGDKSTCLKVAAQIEHLLSLVIPHLELQLKAARTVYQKTRAFFLEKLTANAKWGIGLCLALMLLLIRIPLNLDCNVEVKPVVRRYVAAPFDGVLKMSKVRAGDSVVTGNTLACMDEAEIFLQKSGVEAEIEKYRKQKGSALAKGEMLEMQQAQLEFKRLTYKNDLLNQRSQNLDITSPIDGVVMKNGLEDAEGAPLKQGQVLFEIAPLDRMIFNIYVSQKDIAYVEQGMPVRIRVDACQESFAGEIARIRPQAETFEEESVFVAEVEFDNEAGIVRPGMRGYATIVGKHHSIGWVLFRKPIGYLKRLTGF